MTTSKKKVSIIGSSNWATAVSKLLAINTARLEAFQDEVTMYVDDEEIDGKTLSDIINETHENVKYLPGFTLPANVVAVSNVIEAANDADFLVFAMGHRKIRGICIELYGKIKPTAIGLSLVKGIDKADGGGVELISHLIQRHLKIQVCVMMGANVPEEVAKEKFGESTLGCRDKRVGPVLKDLFQTSYFRVVVVDDVDSVEICGALGYIIACGSGIVLGLGYGEITKAAVIRLGIIEMIKFVDMFYPGSRLATFFESCGVADVVAHCNISKTKKLLELFVKTGRSIQELEIEVMRGQTIHGPYTAAEVYNLLKYRNMEDKFPIFTTIHKICIEERTPDTLIDSMRSHPELVTSLRWKTLIS